MKYGNKIKQKMSAAPLLRLLLYFFYHVKEWDHLFNNNRNRYFNWIDSRVLI